MEVSDWSRRGSDESSSQTDWTDRFNSTHGRKDIDKR